MSRRRLSPLATALLTGALRGGARLGGTAGRRRRTCPAIDSSLMLPRLDGNPQNPPRFRRAEAAGCGCFALRRSCQNFEYRPAFGAGATGFDSTGARRKRKAAGKAKAKSAAAPPAAAARASSAPDDTAPVAALAAPPVLPLANARPPRKQGAPAVQLLPVDATILTAPVALQRTPARAVAGRDAVRSARRAGRRVPASPGDRADRAATTPIAPRTMPPQSSWYSVVAPELQVNSNWARHEFTANLRGSYTSYDTIRLEQPPERRRQGQRPHRRDAA